MAKAMVRWHLKLANRQLALGKHYLFESSNGSKAWSLEEMLEFVETWKHPQEVEVHEIIYGSGGDAGAVGM